MFVEEQFLTEFPEFTTIPAEIEIKDVEEILLFIEEQFEIGP